MRKVIIKNNGASKWKLSDIGTLFISILPGEQVDLLDHYGLHAILRSEQLKTDIQNAGLSLVVNDGTNDITDLQEAKVYVENLYAREIQVGNAPTSSTDTGTKGEVRATATHMYWCIGKDNWRRIPWETF